MSWFGAVVGGKVVNKQFNSTPCLVVSWFGVVVGGMVVNKQYQFDSLLSCELVWGSGRW